MSFRMFRFAQQWAPERVPTRHSASGGGASLDQNDPTSPGTGVKESQEILKTLQDLCRPLVNLV